MQDLILRTQSEVIALKQRAVKLARMWEERKRSTTSPRADRALVLMEVARDSALAAGVIQEIKMALDAKELIDLLVKFRFVETVDDEGAARDFLSRQPKEKVEEGAGRFFNVFKADLGRYGAVHLDRGGRPLLVEGPRLVEFVKWFVEQLLLEKEAERDGPTDDRGEVIEPKGALIEKALAPSLIEVVKNVDISTGGPAVEPWPASEFGPIDIREGEQVTIATKPMALNDGDGEVLAVVTAYGGGGGGVYRKLPPEYDAELARLDKERRANRVPPAVKGPEFDTKGPVTIAVGEKVAGFSRPVIGTYVGADSALRGETALVRVGAKGVLAQFDNRELEYAYGWHAFDLGEFELDANQEGEA